MVWFRWGTRGPSWGSAIGQERSVSWKGSFERICLSARSSNWSGGRLQSPLVALSRSRPSSRSQPGRRSSRSGCAVVWARRSAFATGPATEVKSSSSTSRVEISIGFAKCSPHANRSSSRARDPPATLGIVGRRADLRSTRSLDRNSPAERLGKACFSGCGLRERGERLRGVPHRARTTRG